jgi:hypothetical protein
MPASQDQSTDLDHGVTSRMNIRLATECRRRNHESKVIRHVGGNVAPDALCLRDTLATHYLKQFAQALVVYIEGMQVVINQIEMGDSVRGKCVEAWDSSAQTELQPPVRDIAAQ